jgi:hypothetical protein
MRSEPTDIPLPTASKADLDAWKHRQGEADMRERRRVSRASQIDRDMDGLMERAVQAQAELEEQIELMNEA